MATTLRFPRARFLRAVCAVFAVAFASIRAQIRGLYGADGLEPVAAFLSDLVARNPDLHASLTTFEKIRAYPTLVWLFEPLRWSPSFTMEVIGLLGMTIAVLGVCSSSWRSAVPIAFVWLCYLSIVQCGQTFMHFQWDSFLLEVGFLAIWLAPWRCWEGTQTTDEALETPAAAVWTLRFLFFKFMFMSGSVKIQSRCPTWLGLTALEFHYATQPLPLPLAWYAHQLPPIVNRLAVAATLLLEGPWTFFVLAPHVTLRRFAAASQVLLQIGILLTGNYNFFNILTIVMALAVFDVNAEPRDLEENEPRGRANWIARADSAWQRFQASSRVSLAMWLATAAYCVYSAMEVFSLSVDNLQQQKRQQYSLEHLLHSTTITFLPTVDETQAWIARVLPVSVNYAALTIVCASVWQLMRFVAHSSPKRTSRLSSIGTIVYLLTCTVASLWIFASSVLTLSILDRPYQSSLPPFVYSAYHSMEKLHITSPYGLFRTMTGVGTTEKDGQRFTVVARPELILEGTADNGATWRAFHFKYKPGDIHDRPRLAMPLQPRLDWQMWFAALGDYQSAPWLVHLVHKLLEGSRDVKSLLDTSRDPFASSPPQAIRVQLYYYDFTRMNTSWSREMPYTEVVSSKEDRRWWTRVFAREYLPALEKENPSLLSFVRHHYGDRGELGGPGGKGSCSMGSWWMGSELCGALQVLVDSELAPLCLAAAVLAAKSASAWTISAANARLCSAPELSKLKSE